MTYNDDDWNKRPYSEKEILIGIGFAFGVHALTVLLALLFELSLYDTVRSGGEVPLWIEIVAYAMLAVSSFQCIRVGIVFFELLKTYKEGKR